MRSTIAMLIFLAGMAVALGAEQPALQNETLSVILRRKSVRTYLDRPVEKAKLETLLRAGMAAPSAADKRPWAFIAVTDRQALAALARGMIYGRLLEKAGAAIVVCGVPAESLPGVQSEYWVQDCSAATENILLAAEAVGLGAVWLGVYPVPDRVSFVRQALKIPASVVPLNIVALGYPGGPGKPENKHDPSKVHWNAW